MWDRRGSQEEQAASLRGSHRKIVQLLSHCIESHPPAKQPGMCGLHIYLYTTKIPRLFPVTVTECVDRLLKVFCLGCLNVCEVSN